MDYIDFTGRFDTRIRVTHPDHDGDIRIEISEPDQVGEIYLHLDDVPDLIGALTKVRDMPVPAPPVHTITGHVAATVTGHVADSVRNRVR